MRHTYRLIFDPGLPVFKLLLFILFAVFLWRLIFGRPRGGYPPSASRAARADGAAEDMVRCARCGVHLPRSESLTRSGDFFCSAEHMRLPR